MAQNVTIAGASYSDVPAVNLPKTGGGTATFYDEDSLPDFAGADGTSPGTHGLVPAPAATDNVKFLKGDGTWSTVSGGSMTTLWQNASPTSQFAAQTITLSDAAANYDYVLVLMKFTTDANGTLVSEVLKYDATYPGFTLMLNTGGNRTATRDGSFTTANNGLSMAFLNCTYNNGANQGMLVPYKIFGIKL